MLIHFILTLSSFFILTENDIKRVKQRKDKIAMIRVSTIGFEWAVILIPNIQ